MMPRSSGRDSGCPNTVTGSMEPMPRGPVGDIERVIEIVHENADDFAKPKGHDGEVITAQFQRGRPQQCARDSGQQGSQRYHRIQGQVQPAGKHDGQSRNSFSK